MERVSAHTTPTFLAYVYSPVGPGISTGAVSYRSLEVVIGPRRARGGQMRWYVGAPCLCIFVAAASCGPVTGTNSQGQMGQLLFQKDTSCTDNTNTELFVDHVSQGQVTMRGGSMVGFNKTANTHIADAIERAGKLRDFGVQSIYVPAGGSATYTMTCGTSGPPPPVPSPARR
jgi:hypothetical protein